MKIRFLTLADQEVDEAVGWYDQQVEGLGREFLDELDHVVLLTTAYPRLGTEIEPEIGRFLSKQHCSTNMSPLRGWLIMPSDVPMKKVRADDAHGPGSAERRNSAPLRQL